MADARALRSRLLHALPPQRPAGQRPPEPLGLYARALPAPRHRRDHVAGRDPRALLHDARLAEPAPPDPARAAGLGPRRPARARRALASAPRAEHAREVPDPAVARGQRA